MNFNFNIQKATEVACEFLRREGGTMNIMKLVKLMYLLDRVSLERRGIPVVGGQYFSLPNGPVTSEVLDLINSGCLTGFDECHWEEYISDRAGHEVELVKDKEPEFLSRAELDLLAEVSERFGRLNQWGLRDWCHVNCPEWTPQKASRSYIDLSDIAKALDRDPAEMKSEALESIMVDAALRR